MRNILAGSAGILTIVLTMLGCNVDPPPTHEEEPDHGIEQVVDAGIPDISAADADKLDVGEPDMFVHDALLPDAEPDAEPPEPECVSNAWELDSLQWLQDGPSAGHVLDNRQSPNINDRSELVLFDATTNAIAYGDRNPRGDGSRVDLAVDSVRQARHTVIGWSLEVIEADPEGQLSPEVRYDRFDARAWLTNAGGVPSLAYQAFVPEYSGHVVRVSHVSTPDAGRRTFVPREPEAFHLRAASSGPSSVLMFQEDALEGEIYEPFRFVFSRLAEEGPIGPGEPPFAILEDETLFALGGDPMPREALGPTFARVAYSNQYGLIALVSWIGEAGNNWVIRVVAFDDRIPDAEWVHLGSLRQSDAPNGVAPTSISITLDSNGVPIVAYTVLGPCDGSPVAYQGWIWHPTSNEPTRQETGCSTQIHDVAVDRRGNVLTLRERHYAPAVLELGYVDETSNEVRTTVLELDQARPYQGEHSNCQYGWRFGEAHLDLDVETDAWRIAATASYWDAISSDLQLPAASRMTTYSGIVTQDAEGWRVQSD